MNVKLHTPKTLKAGSGLSSAKQFLLSLLATTISIVLTFGTAGVIDHFKKQAEKKEMVMMVISDFDMSLNSIMKADTALREASRLQQELAVHPEYFDSLRFKFPPILACIDMEFPQTTEKIFSSSIETFNTISNANFVNQVSSFYIYRDQYKNQVLDDLKNSFVDNEALLSVKSLLSISFPEYAYINWSMLQMLKGCRDKCMRMMDVSEEDLAAFSKQQSINENSDPQDDAVGQQLYKEWLNATELINKAQEKLK